MTDQASTATSGEGTAMPMLLGIGVVLYFLRSSSKSANDLSEKPTSSATPLYVLAALVAYCYRETLMTPGTLQAMLPLAASNAALAYGRTYLTASIVALMGFLVVSTTAAD